LNAIYCVAKAGGHGPAILLMAKAFETGVSPWSSSVPKDWNKSVCWFEKLLSQIRQKDEIQEEMEVLFVLNQEVEAKFEQGDVYYPAKVTQCNNDGTYDLLYDDGEVETHVAQQWIQALPSKEKAYAVGTKVEADFECGGTFYPASVSKMNEDGTYDLVYDDGEAETNVLPANIRAIEEIGASCNDSDSTKGVPDDTYEVELHEILGSLGKMLKSGGNGLNSDVTKAKSMLQLAADEAMAHKKASLAMHYTSLAAEISCE